MVLLLKLASQLAIVHSLWGEADGPDRADRTHSSPNWTGTMAIAEPSPKVGHHRSPKRSASRSGLHPLLKSLAPTRSTSGCFWGMHHLNAMPPNNWKLLLLARLFQA